MDWRKLLVISGLALIVGINSYLYQAEFRVLSDPNDNIFQYALIDEAKNIWQNIFAGRLSPFYLLDSWNERWAEGFALSNYYAHLPQAVISLLGLISPLEIYKTFVIVRTLLLIFLPLMFFLGARILSFPNGASFIVALFSQVVVTDGLYGIDLSSFLWRGWGLSSQLFAVFFMPAAFGYSLRYLDFFKSAKKQESAESKGDLLKAVFFNFLVAQSHFGMFSLLLISYGIYIVCLIIYSLIQNQNIQKESSSKFRFLTFDLSGIFKKSIVFFGLTLFFLAYFIIPFFLQGQYRNFSVWDPIWKFDSWGARQTLIWFLQGDFFDFGRLPLITWTVIFGVFWGLAKLGRFGKLEDKDELPGLLSLLFIFFTVLLFGRTTLGSLIDLIPGFSEYHLHRIIVMVQFLGVFLGGWFLYQILINLQAILKKSIFKNLKNLIYLGSISLFLLLVYYLEQPLIRYASDNAGWINRSNKAYLADLPDYEKIKAKLQNLPRARVYAGRPGNWGRNFYVGETPVYMALSRDGIPVIGFLPESWSPNSDPEQFFDEYSQKAYDLYHVGYSILPADIKPPSFARLILSAGKYHLFQIKTGGWFDAGASNIVIRGEKTSLLNITRLWFGSPLQRAKDYPSIDLNFNLPKESKWFIQMTDLNNYINLNDNKGRNIWQANPMQVDKEALPLPFRKESIQIKNQKQLVDGYLAEVEVVRDCQNCILVLKQSFHPNWQVKLNGEKTEAFPVFPFYIGIPVEKAGGYQVIAQYKSGGLKVLLVFVEISALGIWFGWQIYKKIVRSG